MDRYIIRMDSILHILYRVTTMALTKKAKIYSDSQIKQLLNFFNLTKFPHRNKVILLLSAKAGARACEIAGLCWHHVLNNECSDIGGTLRITDDISKSFRGKDGKVKRVGGRRVTLSDQLQEALRELYASEKPKPRYEDRIVINQMGWGMDGHGINMMFKRWFKILGWEGYSSHSGRRSFITNAARKVSLCGMSIHDVMRMAGHTNLHTTQGYIEANPDGAGKLVNMI